MPGSGWRLTKQEIRTELSRRNPPMCPSTRVESYSTRSIRSVRAGVGCQGGCPTEKPTLFSGPFLHGHRFAK